MDRRALPIGLIVMDGWGEAPAGRWNAVTGCRPENIDALRATYPSTLLGASGRAVGLPVGQIGNSEVGHLCLGAGRVVLTDLEKINQAIADRSFGGNAALVAAMDAVRDTGGPSGASAGGRGAALHIMGLFSDGGVHSHIAHLEALVGMARDRAVARVFIHAYLDGRDTPPKSALGLMRSFEARLDPTGPVRIASVIGRYYAMDRDNRWERTEAAYRALFQGEGFTARDGLDAIEAAHKRGETDEFVKPTVVVGHGRPGSSESASAVAAGGAIGRIHDGDSVIFFNFRADRARQITRALTFDAFDRFPRSAPPRLARFTCFGTYDRTFPHPVAFPEAAPERVFGEIAAAAGLRQLRVAETEKYAHVTFFFNGGREIPFDGEDRLLVPSQKVPTYDLAPEMSAGGVTTELIARLRRRSIDFFLLNYANADMVGHTGVYEATVRGCKTVDESVGQVARELLAQGGTVIVTADHGNAEQMWDEATGGPHTAHTTNPVPCIFASASLTGRRLRSSGLLADVAPTMLSLLGLEQPREMAGTSLLL